MFSLKWRLPPQRNFPLHIWFRSQICKNKQFLWAECHKFVSPWYIMAHDHYDETANTSHYMWPQPRWENFLCWSTSAVRSELHACCTAADDTHTAPPRGGNVHRTLSTQALSFCAWISSATSSAKCSTYHVKKAAMSRCISMYNKVHHWQLGFRCTADRHMFQGT